MTVHISKLQPGRRRRLTSQQKRFLLTDAIRELGSVSAVGRAYDVPVSLLFRWRRELDLPDLVDDGTVTAVSPLALALRVQRIEDELDRLRRENRSLREQAAP